MKIAITGTKGKTTIMSLVKHVLRELNKNVISVSSTEGIYYNEEFLYNPRMSKYLVREFDRPWDYQVSEATSKLLKYDKYIADDIDIAAYNGIEKHEHLETHYSFENYLNAKKKLFDLISGQNKIGIVNFDDPFAVHILQNFVGNVYKVGTTSNVDYKYDILEQTTEHMRIKIDYFLGTTKILIPMTGSYNAQNAVMSYVILLKAGIKEGLIQKHFKTFPGVPGRFQKIQLRDGRLIIIDYAHSEESLKLVLDNIKQIYPDRTIITIFGCGGDRSWKKRAPMGKTATQNSSFVYITKDNPRSEPQGKIFANILTGITTKNYSVILNRYDAVERALRFRQDPKTIFLIAGKGSEIKNLEGSRTFNMSDEQRVKEACKTLKLQIK